MEKIEAFISLFTDKKIRGIYKEGRRYFLIQKKEYELSKKISREFFSAGIYLGEVKKEFKPTSALIDLISRISDRKVFINKKAEWLFLCKRDVFDDSIVKKNVDFGLVLVQNQKDENLGYGILQKMNHQLFIKNILDKGEYLRRER